MSNAIRELQTEFDKRLDHQNQQMQSYYQMKVCAWEIPSKQQHSIDELTSTSYINS